MDLPSLLISGALLLFQLHDLYLFDTLSQLTISGEPETLQDIGHAILPVTVEFIHHDPVLFATLVLQLKASRTASHVTVYPCLGVLSRGCYCIGKVPGAKRA